MFTLNLINSGKPKYHKFTFIFLTVDLLIFKSLLYSIKGLLFKYINTLIKVFMCLYSLP